MQLLSGPLAWPYGEVWCVTGVQEKQDLVSRPAGHASSRGDYLVAIISSGQSVVSQWHVSGQWSVVSGQRSVVSQWSVSGQWAQPRTVIITMKNITESYVEFCVELTDFNTRCSCSDTFRQAFQLKLGLYTI